MPSTIETIYTRTAGSGGLGGFDFNNIPQTYTDLKVVISARSVTTGGLDSLGLMFNTVQTNVSNTQITGSGPSNASTSRSTYRAVMAIPGANQTANTFASIEIYIPNYRLSNFKQVIVDGGFSTTSTTVGRATFVADLWSQSTAITSLRFNTATSGQNFAEGSSFSLYGIRNS